MVTVIAVPLSPLPMLLGAPLPFVAVTLVTVLLMVMLPQTPLLRPPPMPAERSLPVAVTVPPLMVILPHHASLEAPLPMPAPPPSPQVAVTEPPLMVM